MLQMTCHVKRQVTWQVTWQDLPSTVRGHRQLCALLRIVGGLAVHRAAVPPHTQSPQAMSCGSISIMGSFENE
jgi:hypothetical protein